MIFLGRHGDEKVSGLWEEYQLSMKKEFERLHFLFGLIRFYLLPVELFLSSTAESPHACSACPRSSEDRAAVS